MLWKYFSLCFTCYISFEIPCRTCLMKLNIPSKLNTFCL
uniref:Uncharacterized protein n=1 Tax=Arundo donax TaxID=35708 RepID=A0A0A8XTJ8_ARUDO